MHAYISLCFQTLNFSVLMLSPSAPFHNPSDATGHTQHSIQTILHAHPTSSLPVVHRMIFESKHINTYKCSVTFKSYWETLPILENPAPKAHIRFRQKALHTNQNHLDSSSFRLLTLRKPRLGIFSPTQICNLKMYISLKTKKAGHILT